jgi:hypothetical protein
VHIVSRRYRVTFLNVSEKEKGLHRDAAKRNGETLTIGFH